MKQKLVLFVVIAILSTFFTTFAEAKTKSAKKLAKQKQMEQVINAERTKNALQNNYNNGTNVNEEMNKYLTQPSANMNRQTPVPPANYRPR